MASSLLGLLVEFPHFFVALTRGLDGNVMVQLFGINFRRIFAIMYLCKDLKEIGKFIDEYFYEPDLVA